MLPMATNAFWIAFRLSYSSKWAIKQFIAHHVCVWDHITIGAEIHQKQGLQQHMQHLDTDTSLRFYGRFIDLGLYGSEPAT